MDKADEFNIACSMEPVGPFDATTPENEFDDSELPCSSVDEIPDDLKYLAENEKCWFHVEYDMIRLDRYKRPMWSDSIVPSTYKRYTREQWQCAKDLLEASTPEKPDSSSNELEEGSEKAFRDAVISGVGFMKMSHVPMDEVFKQDEPVEWDGEGLPPAGEVCEFLGFDDECTIDEQKAKGQHVEIVAHYNTGHSDVAVFVFKDLSGRPMVSQAIARLFRPTQTPEQKAEAEMFKTLQEMPIPNAASKLTVVEIKRLDKITAYYLTKKGYRLTKGDE